MIRLAAVGDVHVGEDTPGRIRAQFAHLRECAGLLLLAGDLSRCGSPAEAKALADEIADAGVPIVTVLGNHDYHAERTDEFCGVLRDAGMTVLEGQPAIVEIDGAKVGVAGTTGFGGGFAGASGSDFGEPAMKAFIRHTKQLAESLCRSLDHLEQERCDLRIALLHYSPVPDTLAGERLEIYPFLGSYLLAEAVDRVGADLVLHGHAHAGSEKGMTPGGVPVRNVAQPVIRQAYDLFHLGPDGSD